MKPPPLILRAPFVGLFAFAAAALAADRSYLVTDTGQGECYGAAGGVLDASMPGEALSGQDAQYQGPPMNFRDNGDGTISDLQTGLMWQKTPGLDRKVTFDEARREARELRLGGHSDWRLPTLKELYSLINFSGGMGHRPSKPYLDTDYFDFAYGDPRKAEREIDAQYWSATEYVGRTMNGNATVFGVNFADGRIKGYPRDETPRGLNRQFVRYVRGPRGYGVNQFIDNGDGTVMDSATGLVWQKADSGRTLNWPEALAYAEALELAGTNDWRLPNAKELQSIVDYSRAPDAIDPDQVGAALDPIFDLTEIESYFWTSTSHLEVPGRSFGGQAVYIAFGRAMGWMGPPGGRSKQFLNVHGAGAQRSDPKIGDPRRFSQGRGPQGDDIRIWNYVRCVRGGLVPTGAPE
jgi:hypothetical protein